MLTVSCTTLPNGNLRVTHSAGKSFEIPEMFYREGATEELIINDGRGQNMTNLILFGCAAAAGESFESIRSQDIRLCIDGEVWLDDVGRREAAQAGNPAGHECTVKPTW